MSRWGRAAAWLIGIAVVVTGRPLAAQSISLVISGVRADSVGPAPTMTVSAIDARPELAPYTVTIELSSDAGFARPFFVDADDGLLGSFTLDSLLAEKTMVFFRARLIDRLGSVTAETRQQHPVQGWVRLIEPLQQDLVNLSTRTPRFIWSSPPNGTAVTLPPGPWVYDLTVTNTATGLPVSFPGLTDTSFVFSPLESNTSYRWQVSARGSNSTGRTVVTVRSSGTFVITTPEQPTATVFYQNFPNPFGRGERTSATCFWFDLGQPATVSLTIFDIRLRRVRRLIPGAFPSTRLPAGAYGRGDLNMQRGCDSRLEWDGRDDNGRIVPQGIYIAEFTADGFRSTRKVYFKGQ